MTLGTLNPRTLEALFRSQLYPGEGEEHKAEVRTVPGLSIAISRQAGSKGANISRLVGEKLHWPVFDRELLQEIAQQTGTRVKLLERIDEKQGHWLRESLEMFFKLSPANDTMYLRHLVETVLTLGSRGECVIVGRGAAQVLPRATTLRVRIVGELADRIEHIQKDRNFTREEAARWVEHTDRERVRFVREHFHHDPNDPLEHDLILNSSRLTPEECAALIVEAARGMQERLSRERKP